MDFFNVIKTRRSIRSYKPDPIPGHLLDRVLDAARVAPSGSNRQPTRLIVIKNRERRESLIPMCNGQKFIAQAPVLIAACGNEIRTNRGGYMGKYSVLLDVAIAMDHLTLAARAVGLGTCWIGSFSNADIKTYLNIPEDVQVVALTPLGYPSEKSFSEITNRMPLEQVVCEETWTF